jgi:hypothetical protein
MNLTELTKEVHNLAVTVDCQTELLSTLNLYCVTNTARLETILSALRGVLARQGLSKDVSLRICREIYVRQLSVAQSENAKTIESHGKSLPPSSASDDVQWN